MANVFSFFGNFSVGNLFTYIKWFFFFVVICGTVMAMTIMILVKKKHKKIIEINMQNRRLRIFSGRMKKKGKGIKQFWAQKIGRALPDFQQKSIYVKGQQDTVILLKDNNGMHHTARIPTYGEIKKWYKTIYNINLDEKDKDGKLINRRFDRLRDVYLLPSPHEDLDWLSNQCVEAEKEFKVNNWWQSPTVAYVATGFICFMMVIVSLIIEKKF